MTSARNAILIALAAGASSLPSVALAQVADQAEAATASATQDVAADAPADDGLGDIVVTARRRAENLQDVPIAVTAFSSEDLQAKAITDRTSLADNTPSLFTINGGYPREFAFFALRGQGPAFGSVPGVVNYFAEVPNPVNIDGRVGSYYDLANVQVLAGPQGTLFGKNATGGNILFEPMKPQNRFEGYVRGQIGNYDDRRLEGAVNLPIVSDKLLLRVAGEIGRRDGYTKDVGPLFEGKDYDNLAYESFRVGLTLRPTDRIEIYTVGRYYNSHTNGGATVLGAFNPAAGFDATPLGIPAFFPTLAFYPGMATAVAEQEERGPRRVAYDLDQFSDTRYWQILNQITVDLTDTLKLKNVISFSKLKTFYGYDYDATINPIAGQTSEVNPANPGLFEVGQKIPTLAPKVFTEELQLQGTAFDKALTFTVGGFLDRTKTDMPAGIAEYFFFPFGTPVLAPSISGIFENKNDSEAVFGQATLELGKLAPSLSGLSVTGGLRYTWEHSFSSQAIGVPTRVEGSVDDQYLSYTATVDYDVTDDVHVYATARSAYKSGGVNGPIPADSEFRTFPPEKLSDIELGLKSKFTLGTVKGRVNIAAYRGVYRNIQRTTAETVETPLGPALLNVTRSAAKGVIKGIEFNGALVPTRGLTLNASYSYIDSEYTKVGDGGAAAILEGAPFPYTPKHKYSVGATYEHSLGSAGELALGVNYTHQSKVSTAQTNQSFYRYLPAYGMLNASIDLRNVGGRPFDIGVFVNNLTDTTKPVGVADFYAAGPGVVGLTYTEPRMYGLRVGYRFGS